MQFVRPVCLLLPSAVFVSFAVPAGLSRQTLLAHATMNHLDLSFSSPNASLSPFSALLSRLSFALASH